MRDFYRCINGAYAPMVIGNDLLQHGGVIVEHSVANDCSRCHAIDANLHAVIQIHQDSLPIIRHWDPTLAQAIWSNFAQPRALHPNAT